MTLKNSILLGTLALLFAVMMTWLLFSNLQPVGASTYDGGVAQLATSSTVVLGPQQRVLIFDSGSSCTNRSISTKTQGIFVSFGTTTVTGTNIATSSAQLGEGIGHWQAASTTQSYDSGIYGCGYMAGFAGVSTTITRTEFR